MLTDLFAIESAIEHIAVAQENELLVVAPATADLIAKMAHGLADDFLTTLYLAFTGPVVLAPAMNVNMWQHPATQANLETLRRRGHRIVEPGSGYLACGMTGPGRLAEPEEIAAAIDARSRRAPRPGRRDRADHRRSHPGTARSGALHLQPLQRQDGLRAGGSRRRARRARDPDFRAGAPGPAARVSRSFRCAPPSRCATGCSRTWSRPAIVIKAAAVADFHLSKVPDQKIKKTAARISLELDPTPDILAELGRKKGDRLLVGFAAETAEPAAGGPPQAGIQELRHGGRQPGGRTPTWASNPTRTK